MDWSSIKQELFMAPSSHGLFCRLVGRYCAVLCLLAAGCNTSGNYPVTGQVTDKQGQPIAGLAGSEIVFSGVSFNSSSVGEIAEDGSFTLFTQRPGDGVPPGEYQVYIPRRRIDPEREAPPSIDARFENPQSSDLRATVEQKSNHFEFQVDPVAARPQ